MILPRHRSPPVLLAVHQIPVLLARVTAIMMLNVNLALVAFNAVPMAPTLPDVWVVRTLFGIIVMTPLPLFAEII